MKKTYQKPEIQSVKLNVELPMAASSGNLNIYDDTLGGSEALGNMESDYDVWNN